MFHCASRAFGPRGSTPRGIRLDSMRKRFDSFQRGLRPAKARSSFVTPPVRHHDRRLIFGDLHLLRTQDHSRSSGRRSRATSSRPCRRITSTDSGPGQARAERLSQGDRPVLVTGLRRIAFSQIGAFTARDIVRSHQWSHLLIRRWSLSPIWCASRSSGS